MFKFATLLISLALASIEEIKDLEKSEFGKSLIETVQLQMSLNGSDDKLKESLENLKTKISQEHQNSEEDYESFKADCQVALKTFNENAMNAGTNKMNAFAGMKRFEMMSHNSQEQIIKSKQSRDSTLDEKQKLQSLKAQGDESFERRINDYKAAVEACEKSVGLISELNISGETMSFLEVDRVETSQLKQHLDTINKVESGMKKMLTNMLQTASKSSGESKFVTKVIVIINKLRRSFESSIEDLHKSHEQTQEKYSSLLSILDSKILNLSGEIEILESAYSSSNAKLQETKQGLASADQHIEEIKNLKLQKESLCESRKQEYHSGSEKRKDELEKVNKVLNMIDDQFEDFTSYIEMRKRK